ncbi:serine protease 23-like [Anneissia japonica]|uniref:serine protease 23-like n=1 Tax=Anneissia japonica TaxID=1529436 RepID=UPI0014255917|nr:serine protease 23-like [Anneissia japonica]XP_033096911.1 serine protease 23-like [Anneissia japonica]
MSVGHYSVILIVLCTIPCFFATPFLMNFQEYRRSVNESYEPQVTDKKEQNTVDRLLKQIEIHADSISVDEDSPPQIVDTLFSSIKHIENNGSKGFDGISVRRRRSGKLGIQGNRAKSARRHGRKWPRMNNVYLNISTMKTFPYKNAVRVGASIFQSPGCTGYLLDNRHVLTAAHCIHDGKNFSIHLRSNNMRVTAINDRPGKIRFIIYNITNARVPTGWLKPTSSAVGGHWKNFDYAILTLSTNNRPELSTGNDVRFGMPNYKDGIATVISYTWYRRSFQPVKTTCKIPKNGFSQSGNRLMTKCNAELGSSGSAVFMNTIRAGDIIAGIVSHRYDTFEVINILTSAKVENICSMIAGDLSHRDIPTKLPTTCQKNGYKKHQLLRSNYVSFSGNLRFHRHSQRRKQ